MVFITYNTHNQRVERNNVCTYNYKLFTNTKA